MPYDIPGAMHAGDLRHRVQIERDIITRTDGEEIRTPTVLATVWAEVELLSGAELWKAQEVNSRVNVRVTMRYGASTMPTTADRVIFTGKRMEITAVLPDTARKSFVVLECYST